MKKTEEPLTMQEMVDDYNSYPKKKEDKRSHLSAPMVGKYPRLMGNV